MPETPLPPIRAAPTGSEHRPPGSSRDRPLILIVDDSAGFAETLADVLETRGYQALAVGTAAAALEALRLYPVALAVVDLRLSGTAPRTPADGLELLDRIKAESPETEVLILTGYGTVKTAVAAMNRGAFGYLEKPCAAEKLSLLIEQALAHRAEASCARPPGCRGGKAEPVGIPWCTYDPESGRISAADAALVQLLGFRPDHLNQLLTDSAERDRHLASARTQSRAESDFATATGRRFRICSFVPETAAGNRPSAAGADNTGQKPKPECRGRGNRSKPGKPVHAVIIDVTAEHRRRAESDRLRLYFEALFDNLAVGIVIIDSNYVIIRANPAFARFHDLRPEALIGQRCHELIQGRATPCHQHGEICPIKNSLATGTAARVLQRHLDAAGRVHHFNVLVAPMRDDSGTIVSFAAIHADVTEIRRTQQELEIKTRRLEQLNARLREQQERIVAQSRELAARNRELVAADSAKDEFLATVSHELRTPLTSIIEGIGLITDGTLGPVNDRQTRFLKLALDNSARLGRTINALLDSARCEAGRVECRPAVCDLYELLNDIAAGFGPVAQARGLELIYAPGPRPLLVFADPNLVHRSLDNLLGNALKFTDQGHIRLAYHIEADQAVVTVADTGIGIPADEQELVFKRFHQSARDRARPGGIGLGLPLARKMVSLNGGRVWLENSRDAGAGDPGEKEGPASPSGGCPAQSAGSVFRFTLPLDRPQARLAWLLRSSPSTVCRSGGRLRWLLLVRSSAANGLSARLDDACRLAGGRDPVPGCLLPVGHPGMLALLIHGTETDARAAARRVSDRLDREQHPAGTLKTRVLPISPDTKLEHLQAAIMEEPDDA